MSPDHVGAINHMTGRTRNIYNSQWPSIDAGRRTKIDARNCRRRTSTGMGGQSLYSSPAGKCLGQGWLLSLKQSAALLPAVQVAKRKSVEADYGDGASTAIRQTAWHMTLSCRRICRNYSKQINKLTAKTKAQREAAPQGTFTNFVWFVLCRSCCHNFRGKAEGAKGKVAAGGKGEGETIKIKPAFCHMPFKW